MRQTYYRIENLEIYAQLPDRDFGIVILQKEEVILKIGLVVRRRIESPILTQD